MAQKVDPREVVRAYQMVMEGYQVDAVAVELGIHRATVYRHVKRVERDLQSVEQLRKRAFNRLLHFLSEFAADYHAADRESVARVRAASNIVAMLREMNELLGLKGSGSARSQLSEEPVIPRGPGVKIVDVPGAAFTLQDIAREAKRIKAEMFGLKDQPDSLSKKTTESTTSTDRSQSGQGEESSARSTIASEAHAKGSAGTTR